MKLELRGITKSFGALVANDHVDLEVSGGEVLCLLGENGAGKSTLMNTLFGLHRPDSGEILIDDKVATFESPGDAIAAGIGMVHQHFMLVPVFTVAENVILGNEDTRFGVQLDLNAARRKVLDISEQFGFHIDPDAVVGDLPVGVQQRVEIIKALSRDARILVFDEPTAVLTPQETDELMNIMRKLAESGCAILFITHKLREVREVASRISILRRGRVVGEASPGTSDSELAALMVGRPVELVVPKGPPTQGAEGLRIDHLTVLDTAGYVTVDDVSLSIRQGEVLGIAGVQGNGQTELAEAIIGLRPSQSGDITLGKQRLSGASVRASLASGIGFVPEDRKVDGLVGEFSITENLMLDRSHGDPFVRFGLMRRAELSDFATDKVQEFDIRTPSTATAVSKLSGGNQQKVVLARELSRNLKLFIASQPTRGIDVGSIEFVHRRIIQERDSGVPVLVISTELDEVVALSDRIAVMYRGRVVGIVPATTSRRTLGLMMAGIPAHEEEVEDYA
ncbi:UNVERIFIED_ORG: ABC-type uncharacterized transport system ATPase subunit [Arthrobacter sp. UYCu721]